MQQVAKRAEWRPPIAKVELEKWHFERKLEGLEQLRAWFGVMNGGVLEGAVYGLGDSSNWLTIDFVYSLFPGWKSNGWVPIASDGCGNYYVAPTKNEFGTGLPIVFIDSGESLDRPAYIVASDIWIFLEGLMRTELTGGTDWPWPVEADPALRSFALRTVNA